jgi:hypothetical protein
VVLLAAVNIFAQPTWTQQVSPVSTDVFSCWAVSDQVGWIGGTSNVIIRTTNGGTTWTLANTGVIAEIYSIFAFDENNCWAGAGDGALWHTTNGGANWTWITMSPATPFIDAVYFWDANLGFVMGDPAVSPNLWRYYITTNGGANWTLGANAPPYSGTEAGWNNSWASTDTGHIWWGTNVTKIWKGSFMGPFNSYPTTGSLNSYGVWFNNANTGVASFSAGAIKNSTDGGVTWTTGTFTPTQTPFGLRGILGTTYIWMSCGTTTAGSIYRSTNNGVAFVSQISIPSNPAYCIGMNSINHGWAGTATGKIYRYTDNVGVGNPITTPTEFKLSQNYPNPFNPTTTIDFVLSNAGYVSLKVYDMMGKEVEILIDGVESAGSHQVIYNASKLSSGTYFYQMKSGEFKDTKTMVIVK